MEQQLFSDARVATMPITAPIGMVCGVLLAISASWIDRLTRVQVAAVFTTLVLACGFATSARADTYPAASYWVYCAGGSCPGAGTTNNYASASAACKGANTSYKLGAVMQSSGGVPVKYQCLTMYDTDSGHTADKRWQCLYGGTLSGTSCFSAPACPAGQVRNATTGQCESSPCTAGQIGADRFVVGYQKKPFWDGVTPPDQPSNFSANVCVPGSGSSNCSATLTGYVSGTALVQGSQPMYPVSGVFEWKMTGGTCVGSEPAPATLNEVPAPCPPGTASGSVNGVVGCFAVSTATSNTTTQTNPDGSITTKKTTTGPTGTTIETTTCNASGCNTTIEHIGGGGSTESPAESGGDYDGGGANGGVGGGTAGGDGEGDEEQDPCGIAGFPDCGVKVNETGTPGSAPSVEAGVDEAKQKIEERYMYLQGMGWIKDQLPFIWSPQLPSGYCSDYEIMGRRIDVCPTLDRVRLFWSWALAFMAGLYIWRTGTGAVKG